MGAERARPGTFRGFGIEPAGLGTLRGFGTERARLGTFKKKLKNLEIFTQNEHVPAQRFFKKSFGRKSKNRPTCSNLKKKS